MYERITSPRHSRICTALLLLGLIGCIESGLSESAPEPSALQVASETTKKPLGSADYRVQNGGDLCSGKTVKRIKYDKGVHFSFGSFTVNAANSTSSSSTSRCWLELWLPAVPGYFGRIQRVAASGSAHIPQGSNAQYLVGIHTERVRARPFTTSGEFSGGWVKTQRVPEDVSPQLLACGQARHYPLYVGASVSGSLASTTVTDLLVEVVWQPCTCRSGATSCAPGGR